MSSRWVVPCVRQWHDSVLLARSSVFEWESAGEDRPERRASISPPKHRQQKLEERIRACRCRSHDAGTVEVCKHAIGGAHARADSAALTQAARRKSERQILIIKLSKNRCASHLVDMMGTCGEMSCVARSAVHVRNAYLTTRTSQPFDVRVFASLPAKSLPPRRTPLCTDTCAVAPSA